MDLIRVSASERTVVVSHILLQAHGCDITHGCDIMYDGGANAQSDHSLSLGINVSQILQFPRLLPSLLTSP